MSYDDILKLNRSEIGVIIGKLKEGTSFKFSGESDRDPYGSGAYDVSTLGYNKETGKFTLKVEFWESQYNHEPEVTMSEMHEEPIIRLLLTVHRSRLMEA